MAQDTILLTGATGAVGHEVVRTLLSRAERPRLLLLMRGNDGRAAFKLARLLAWSGVRPGSSPDVIVLRGDASRRRLGLSPTDFSRVTSETTAILHLAASTSFDQSRRAARFNVLSARRVLEMALRCRRLDRVGVVSTAFVAGRRSGTIQEHELEFQEGFSNEYERSKAVAERDCREAMARLPIAIYRLSIVVGRRGDGRISHSGMFSAVCRLMRRRLLPFLPGDPAQSVDIIPADFAADSLTAMLRGAFIPGRTYHVCGGRARSPTWGGLIQAIVDGVNRTARASRGHELRGPLFMTSDEFGDFLEHPGGTRRLQRVGRSILRLTSSLQQPKHYETSAFESAVGPCGIRLAHAREWLPPVIDRALGLELVPGGEVDSSPARGTCPEPLGNRWASS